MKQTDDCSKDSKQAPNGSSRPNRKTRRSNHSRSKGKGRSNTKVEKLDETRSNNPAWYYYDERIADQVSQLSFQNLAGLPIHYDGTDFDVPNIVRVALNPSPGVQTSAMYNTALSQSSALNMAAFKLYSKLSAFTGRVQSYAPQDVGIMELAFGEVISMFEFIRRGFGVAYTMNMRNRDYPRHVLNFGMCIDADDLFANYSNYRTRFNTIVTLFNQLPIPKNVAYFDKCAAIYQKIYLDSPSAMAQTIIPVPYTTWVLDEQSYSGGSILKTTQVTCDPTFQWPLTGPQLMSVYLNLLESMVATLLNSSSLQVVYTDIMNLATKQSLDFWKMDYLLEGYTVVPEYDTNFLLQMHNATVASYPIEPIFNTSPNVTPYNDVYPDPNKNSIFYNPAFETIAYGSGYPHTGVDVLIDMMTDAPTLTDRVEVTRYSAVTKGNSYTTSTNVAAYIDAALPDHYVVCALFEQQTTNLTHFTLWGTVVDTPAFRDISSQIANIDWAPRVFEIDSNTGNYTGRYTGDVNFYTVVNEQYLRKLHDFCGLALYDVSVCVRPMVNQ